MQEGNKHDSMLNERMRTCSTLVGGGIVWPTAIMDRTELRLGQVQVEPGPTDCFKTESY